MGAHCSNNPVVTGSGGRQISAVNRPRGRVAIVGAGPAGMAAALSLHQVGHEVVIFERHQNVRPLGGGLSLWPAPRRAMELMGCDVTDFGAPCLGQFKNSKGRLRAEAVTPEHVLREYGGCFFGLLRPELYERLMDALPPGVLRSGQRVTSVEHDRESVKVHVEGEIQEFDLVVGADGIMSVVRELVWGDSPIREHNLHAIVGHSLDPDLGIERGYSLIHHDRNTQASWTSIRLRGVDGFQWWVVQRHSAKREFDDDPVATALAIARNFDPALTRLIETSDPSKVVRWQIRDRKPMDHLTRGRVVLTGDAAHPVSPYAAYGAGMAVEDGYFLGRALAGVDLTDFDALSSALSTYEGPRLEHTARQVQAAFVLGQVFHRLPRPLGWLRDLVLDHTPLLQKFWAESIPGDIHHQLAAIEAAENSLKLRPGAG